MDFQVSGAKETPSNGQKEPVQKHSTTRYSDKNTKRWRIVREPLLLVILILLLVRDYF